VEKGHNYLKIRQGLRWKEKIMPVNIEEGGSRAVLCRHCLREYGVTLMKAHQGESPIEHCPFCRSSRVVLADEGPETKETMRKETEEAARKVRF
jgi:hypothetical protein